MARLPVCLAIGLIFLAPRPAAASHVDPTDFSWSNPTGVNELFQPYGETQANSPRDARGLALSPGEDFVYIGYNTSLDPTTGANRSGEVRRLRTDQLPGFDGQPAGPFDVRVLGHRGKAIATDDLGRVYLAEGTSVDVYSADLSTMLGSITTAAGGQRTEGVHVQREGGTLRMYTTNRDTGALEKRILTESGSDITAAVADPSLNVTGSVALGGDVRGVDVDETGQIWVAGFGTDQVFRVSADGTTIDTVAVTNAIDVTTNGDAVLVSQFTNNELTLIDANTLVAQGGLVPPFLALGLEPDGEPTSDGALSGIEFFTSADLLQDGKDYGFFLNNEAGAGRMDSPPPIDDMNEPLLAVNLVPEPTALLLGTLALVGFFGLTRRRTHRG